MSSLLAEGIKGKVDVLMISETKIDETFRSRQFYIEGFTHLTGLIETWNYNTNYIVRIIVPSSKLSWGWYSYICQRGYYIPSKLIEMNSSVKRFLLN